VGLSTVRCIVLAVLVGGSASGCGREPETPKAPPALAPVALLRAKAPLLPEASYWVDAAVTLSPASVPALRLPHTTESLALTLSTVEEEQRATLLEDGFVLSKVPLEMPPFHSLWLAASQNRPTLVTSDAMLLLLRAAIHRALAEAEAVTFTPLLLGLLVQLGGTLRAEAATAPPDLQTPLAIARRFVLVAEALATQRSVSADASDAAVVQAELLRIERAEQVAISPVLGSALDYRVFAKVPKGFARAVAWLTSAPFPLLAKTEALHGEGDVGLTRDRFRAAMLLAHAADADVDARAATSFQRLDRYARWLFGTPTEAGLSDLQRAAANLRFDLADPDTLLNIRRVDLLRKLLAQNIVRNSAKRKGQHALTVLNVLPPAASFDTYALTRLSETKGAAAAGNDLARVLTDVAPLPSTLDERSAELRAQYLERESKHSAVYDSLLNLVATLATPSNSDSAALLAVSPRWEKKRSDLVAATWALLRSEGTLVGRSPVGLDPVQVPFVPNRDVRVHVEPVPEAILKMLLTLEQVARGMGALHMLSPAGTANRVLAEVDAALRSCLAIAIAASEDREFGGDTGAALLDKLTWLERALGPSGAFETRTLTPVLAHIPKQVSLAVGVEATRAIDVVMRVPGSRDIEVARGFVLPYRELVLKDRDAR
jgi:hypothetical protein